MYSAKILVSDGLEMKAHTDRNTTVGFGDQLLQEKPQTRSQHPLEVN